MRCACCYPERLERAASEYGKKVLIAPGGGGRAQRGV